MIFDLTIRDAPNEVARYLLPLAEMLGSESLGPNEEHFTISDYLDTLTQFGVYAGEFIENNDPTLLTEYPEGCRRLLDALSEMSSAAETLRRAIEGITPWQPDE